MRRFTVASSAKLDGKGKAERITQEALNPIEAVWRGHPRLCSDVVWNVRYKSDFSTIRTSYFEVETPSGIYKVSVEETD